ncbi:unknown [Crocosphaera subtropica ATCC 51142]|uniref:DUF3887 domain-containing protein n=1 Tax=Crocosphaera subtropica (strain ATCC 51142 / BH68) TaxID=43989 RepID=B1WNS8_CROS5|nr:DUF3887 domain-containing protein [Crocosphaera subtropica]ACB51507.1 unknown [Crocosphaera subtropica ATCC 51142]
MNWSLTSLKQNGLPLLVVTLVTGIGQLPVIAQVKLTPPPPVKLVQSSKQVDEEGLKEKAAQMMQLLTQEDYNQARTLLNRDLAVQLTSDQIGEIWSNLIEVTGPVKEIVSYRVIPSVNANIVVVETAFEDKTDDFVITFNQQGEIVGVDFPNVASIEEIAQIMVNSVAVNDFARARGYLHPSLKSEILPNRLQTAWQNIQRENGLFERIESIEVRPGSGVNAVDLVVVEAKFQKGIRKFFFIFDDNRRIVGINLAE